ncbi:MAG: hypothetical protein WD749_08090 [Phycisphaerales bacterium]
MTPALLCERCGYDLGGLAQDAVCPECGTPIDRSLPRSRPGSPWQQGPSPGSWVRTLYRSLRHPTALFDSLRFDRSRRDAALLLSGLACTVILALVPLLSWALGATRGTMIRTGPTTFLFLQDEAPVVGAALSGLALIVAVLWLRPPAWYRRRGWRLTPAIVRAILAHASPSMSLLALGVVALWVTGRAFARYAVSSGNAGALEMASLGAPWTFPVMLVFVVLWSLLLEVGIRRCRFANVPPGPGRGAGSAVSAREQQPRAGAYD